jgi:hypothetical protein
MAHKKFKKFWFCYGILSGFGLGFSISRHWINIDLGFFYLALEY